MKEYVERPRPTGKARSSNTDSGCDVAPPVRATAGLPRFLRRTADGMVSEPSAAGQVLDPETKAVMEPLFGHDFGAVRIHEGAGAARSARAADAIAYTAGNHIVLDQGLIPNNAYSRRSVLAHELAHVVQQSKTHSRIRPHRSEELRAEVEADLAAGCVMRGHQARVQAGYPVQIQRLPRSLQSSVDPSRMSSAQIDQEIREIDLYLATGVVSTATRKHLEASRSALVAAGGRGSGSDSEPKKSQPTAPLFGLQPASDSFHGIQLLHTVKSLPFSESVVHTFNRDPYLMALQEVTESDGTRRVAYYLAYRRAEFVIGSDQGWNEYVVGPDSIDRFLANISSYSSAGAVAFFGGPPSPHQAASARAMQRLMEGDFRGTASALGDAWVAAFEDPSWWAQVAMAGAGGLGRTPVRAPVRGGAPRLTVHSGGRLGSVPMKTTASGSRVVASPPRAMSPQTSASLATQGNAALKPVPAARPAAAATPQPHLSPVTTSPASNVATKSASIQTGIAGMTIAGLSVAGRSSTPVMPSGLSKPDQELWRQCVEIHDTYKGTQAEAANLSVRIKPLAAKVHNNTATAQERVDYCLLIDELIKIVKRLHSERLDYIRKGCDKFDWFDQGTTEAERRQRHVGEAAQVDSQVKNLYELRNAICE